jgi:hypothetical protein
MTIKNCLAAGLLLLCLALCGACATTIVRGQAPLVRMSELSHADARVNLQLNIRNLNGEPMQVEAIEFRLQVDDEDLIDYQGSEATTIAANGVEARKISAAEAAAGKRLLDELEAGKFKSLPYSLEGKVITEKDGSLRFSSEGHIYTMPGKPGYFR